MIIKKLDEFFDLLNETFEKSLEIKWINQGNDLIGLFSTNENAYQINCIDKGDNIWRYDFYHVTKSTNFTFSPNLLVSVKDRFNILSTVKEGLYYLINNKEVDAIVFGATDRSRGRKKLYERFCKDFSIKTGYKFYTRVQNDNQLFLLFKENIDLEILTNKVISIIDEEKDI